MGLFFLIAGYFVPQAYDRKGLAGFLSDRLLLDKLIEGMINSIGVLYRCACCRLEERCEWRLQPHALARSILCSSSAQL